MISVSSALLKVARCKLLNRIRILAQASLIFFIYACLSNANSTELVYTPVNPSFGGNPLNGQVLLNSAQAQNKTRDPEEALSRQLSTSPLQQFNDTLQRSILGRLAAASTSQVVDQSGRLIPGRVETGDFVISISEQGSGVLLITTTDKQTSTSTSFQVSQ